MKSMWAQPVVRVGRLGFWVAILWMLAAPRGAAAQFGQILDLSAAGEQSGAISVTVDPAGTSTVVWQVVSGPVQARMLTAAGVLGPIQDLSLAGAAEAQAAADPSGIVTVAWTLTAGSQTTIQARRVAPDGTLGATLDVSAAGFTVSGPAVAVDPAGEATVAWAARADGETLSRVHARRISAAGVLGPPVELWVDESGPQPRLLSQGPGVGVDAAGNATVVWTSSSGSFVQAFGADFFSIRRVNADGSLGPILDVMTFGHRLFGGAGAGITVDPDGTAIVIATSDSFSGGSNFMEARRVASDGSLGVIHGLFGCPRQNLSAALSAGGRTTILGSCTFTSPGVGFQSRFLAQQIGPDDVLGPVLVVSDDASFVDGRFAPNALGGLTVVWALTDFMNSRVHSRQLFPTGQLGAVVDLAPASDSEIFDLPLVAVDPTGLTTVVWTLGDPSIAIVQATQGVVPVFADVTGSHPLRTWIEALFRAGVTGGCSMTPLQYCPDADVTRAQMAVFLLRGIHDRAYAPPAATGTVFDDVPADHPLAAWIEELKAEGITGGCSASPPLFCPDGDVTRGAMAVFLLRARHGAAFVPPPASGTMFADVPPFHPFADWIEELAREGITTGCGGGGFLYCPNAPVTRGQMAVFLVRTFGLPM